jgi:hypothetical protein
MALVLSTPTTVAVRSFPYALPDAGQAVLIGTNTADDIRPASHSSDDWRYSLFYCYGSGCYVPDYSSGGAYVIAGTGGHQGPANLGAAVFDFADATWKRIDNSNGMPSRSLDLAESETTGAPDYAISIAGVTPNTIPAPAHTYLNVLPIRSANGGGPKGSIVRVIGAAVCREARVTHRSYRFNLATGAWSKLSVNRQTDAINVGSAIWYEAPSVYDPEANRYYQYPAHIHWLNRLACLDGTDWTWKNLPSMPSTQNVGATECAWLDPIRRLILISSISANALFAVNLNNLAAGPIRLNISGKIPTRNRWDFYPFDGCFYAYDGMGGQVLYKLSPPSTNPLTGTWTFSTVSIAGATLPVQYGTGRHYSRFFYVPPLQAFAWIAAGGSRVALIRP